MTIKDKLKDGRSITDMAAIIVGLCFLALLPLILLEVWSDFSWVRKGLITDFVIFWFAWIVMQVRA
jgi:hypothetical protein